MKSVPSPKLTIDPYLYWTETSPCTNDGTKAAAECFRPGLRENGGQYTHAAVWAVLAFARLGETDKACQQFACSTPSTTP